MNDEVPLMKHISTRLSLPLALLLVATGWAPSLVNADPPNAEAPGRASAEGKTAPRVNALQALAEARNKGKAPQSPPADSPREHSAPAGASPNPNAPVELKERAGHAAAVGAMQAAANRAKREQVRRTRQRELRTKLKIATIPPRVRAELRVHARRISRLQRIRALAVSDAAAVARVDALIAKENAHHDRRIAMLVLAGVTVDPANHEGAADQDDEAEE